MRLFLGFIQSIQRGNLKELHVLPRFIIGGHNINSIRYEDDTEMLADTERKLQEFFDEDIKENRKTGLTTT